VPRRDADQRMLDTVISLDPGPDPHVDLSRLDREHFPEWIAALRSAEAHTRALRQRLEDALVGVERQCPVCRVILTGRSDRVYCSATCRQKARRAEAS